MTPATVPMSADTRPAGAAVASPSRRAIRLALPARAATQAPTAGEVGGPRTCLPLGSLPRCQSGTEGEGGGAFVGRSAPCTGRAIACARWRNKGRGGDS